MQNSYILGRYDLFMVYGSHVSSSGWNTVVILNKCHIFLILQKLLGYKCIFLQVLHLADTFIPTSNLKGRDTQEPLWGSVSCSRRLSRLFNCWPCNLWMPASPKKFLNTSPTNVKLPHLYVHFCHCYSFLYFSLLHCEMWMRTDHSRQYVREHRSETLKKKGFVIWLF